MIYFTSDNHFGHKNIIKYCNRPFEDIDEMHRVMIEKWNNTVTQNDTVYVLGDFSFMNIDKTNELLSKLNGYKILVSGNHDKKPNKWNFDKLITNNTEIELNGTQYLLSHYPYPPTPEEANEYDIRFLDRRYEDRGIPLLHGHVHQHYRIRKTNKGTIMLNVGVDVHDFKPISELQIKEMIENENV